MSIATIAGMVTAIALIVGLAIYTGAKKKDGKKGGISSAVVAGLIMGTLAGGSSTVGTAQLAYTYGMSAWWFTLGGGISCLVLAIIYVKPMRRSGSGTLVGMIGSEYGHSAGLAASVLNSVGTFINILAQLLAASTVVLVVLPQFGAGWAIALSALLMVLYVVFGGAKGAGVVGILKLCLLYVSMILCGVLALRLLGGMPGLKSAAEDYTSATGRSFFNLFNRGFGTDMGACISLVLGVLTTQTYAQAIMSAHSDRDARIGAVISAVLIPPIGILGIVVGLYMRTVTDPAVFTAKTALTRFILDYSGLPGAVSGIHLGTLLITSVGTGAGLALGIAAIIRRDILGGRTKKLSQGFTEKLIIVAVLALAAIFSVVVPSETILQFSFMSMGLRGCTVFAPLCFVIWAKGKVAPKYAVLSITVGSGVALLLGLMNLFGVLSLPCDAVFPGVAVGLAFMFTGLLLGGNRRELHI